MNELVFLVVLTFAGPGAGFEYNYHKMENMEVCQECVANAKIEIAENKSRSIVALYCANKKAVYQRKAQRQAEVP